MEKIKPNKYLIVIFIILIVLLIYLLYNSNKNEKFIYKTGEDISLKHYKENEYIPVNISYDQMAKIYLQDYVNKIYLYPEEAYSLLDSEYRKIKFPTFESFNEYIEEIMSMQLQETQVVKYAITDKSNYRDFDVYDSSDNLFIFREKGVMQYTVFFDRYTVDMNS